MKVQIAFTAATFFLLLLSSTVAAWNLVSTLSGTNFWDGFSFSTDPDPTHGFVQYVSQPTANSLGLTYVQNGKVIIKADNTTVSSSGGRNSVRLTSKRSYTGGLFILDLAHMPYGCGTWPAFWLVGPNWPNSGEIDVIEGVNLQTADSMTLHTGSGCSYSGISRNQTGTVSAPNCDVNAAGQSSNAGCGVQSTKANSYGSGFNTIGGGVYATQWTMDGGIQVWFFPRTSIPSDITHGSPDPNTWPVPDATFPFSNNFCPSSMFANMNIVFDLTFCGDWAGSVYSTSGCPSTCNAYVQNNPSAFTEAYWSINYLHVYQ
ncbi:concanavalin A-like lectin/glucanase domain-containing protein [Chlamydoabsidia padenii]|nr:concanavalin A-like lectin/glucanase domain-containing protein [Chlamydoabsidia padenii]